MALSTDMPWHEGEDKMHDLMHTGSFPNPTSSLLTPFADALLQRSPLLAVGCLDADGNPWTTLWGGAEGFVGGLGASVIGLRANVDRNHDPVVNALLPPGAGKKGALESDGGRKMVSGLGIDLETRRRVKIYGRMLGGSLDDLVAEDKSEDGEGHDSGISVLQMAVNISESTGNCPKYLNKKHITAASPSPTLLSTSATLSAEALAIVEKSDLFFISSSNGLHDMDTNHRGGPKGFVRVPRTSTSERTGTQIVYPEYSGNRLYQTLGNLQTTSRAGLVFPDFSTGDVLHVTGTTEVLIGADAAAVIAHSNLAVRLTVTSALHISNGLSFRGQDIDMSPYNPRVRLLATETALLSSSSSKTSSPTATLLSKTSITPTILRYRFRADPPPATPLKPGQWVALDFSPELDMGYSHMRDDDPLSLNDDFVRTFTVSSAPPTTPPSAPPASSYNKGYEFDITARTTGGPITALLSRQRPDHHSSARLEVPILGFGGDFSLPLPSASSPPQRPIIFVAGGVGITPLMPHLPFFFFPSSTPSSPPAAGHKEKTGTATGGGAETALSLLWTLRQADLPLALEVLGAYPALARATRLFVTSADDDDDDDDDDAASVEIMSRLEALGAGVQVRRLQSGDVRAAAATAATAAGGGAGAIEGKEGGRKRATYYICSNATLRGKVQEWLDGEGHEVVVEGFDF